MNKSVKPSKCERSKRVSRELYHSIDSENSVSEVTAFGHVVP